MLFGYFVRFASGGSVSMACFMIFRLRWPWAGLAVLALAGCVTFKSSPPTPPSRPGSNIFHLVKPGENLFRIGKAYDVSIDELAKANRLKDANQIYVGQKLLIPGANRQLPVDTIACCRRPRCCGRRRRARHRGRLQRSNGIHR